MGEVNWAITRPIYSPLTFNGSSKKVGEEFERNIVFV